MSRPSAVVMVVVALLTVTTLAFAQQAPTPPSNRTMVVVIPLKYANPALIALVVGGTVISALNDAQWAQRANGGQNGGYNTGNRQSQASQPVFNAGNSAYGDPNAAYGSRSLGGLRGGYSRQPAGGGAVLALP